VFLNPDYELLVQLSLSFHYFEPVIQPPIPYIKLILRKNTNPPSQIPVRIVHYHQKWPSIAIAEMKLIHSVLSDNLLCIEHIGSTAVPGLAAKPIIDLMPIVANLEKLDQEIRELEAHGYQIHGESGIPGRRFCTKLNVKGERIFHVHFFDEKSDHIIRHLAFRDYLRAHTTVAKEYEQEKLRAATLQPANSIEYNSAKSGWVKIHEQKALQWLAARPISSFH